MVETPPKLSLQALAERHVVNNVNSVDWSNRHTMTDTEAVARASEATSSNCIGQQQQQLQQQMTVPECSRGSPHHQLTRSNRG